VAIIAAETFSWLPSTFRAEGAVTTELMANRAAVTGHPAADFAAGAIIEQPSAIRAEAAAWILFAVRADALAANTAILAIPAHTEAGSRLAYRAAFTRILPTFLAAAPAIRQHFIASKTAEFAGVKPVSFATPFNNYTAAFIFPGTTGFATAQAVRIAHHNRVPGGQAAVLRHDDFSSRVLKFIIFIGRHGNGEVFPVRVFYHKEFYTVNGN